MKLQGHTLLQRAALTTFPFNFTSNGTTTTLTLSVFRCHQSLPHQRLRFIPTYTNTGPSPRVDVNNNQLQQEEQDDLEVRVEKVSFQVADALDQPFPDGQFDLVWSMESGEHMPDKAKFVSELARVAAPGAIVTWCHRDLGPDEESLKPWEEKHLKKICDAFYLPAWCSTADYVRLLESLSLQDIKSEDWSPYVAPFWPAVIRSALSWKGLTSLLRSGLKTIKGALAMPLMIEGFKKDLIKFAIITCRKPE